MVTTPWWIVLNGCRTRNVANHCSRGFHFLCGIRHATFCQEGEIRGIIKEVREWLKFSLAEGEGWFITEPKEGEGKQRSGEMGTEGHHETKEVIETSDVFLLCCDSRVPQVIHQQQKQIVSWVLELRFPRPRHHMWWRLHHPRAKVQRAEKRKRGGWNASFLWGTTSTITNLHTQRQYFST